jgi:hypothetical protein
VLAEADDRDERRVRALARSLRTAIEQGTTKDRLGGLTRAALGFDQPGDEVPAPDQDDPQAHQADDSAES